MDKYTVEFRIYGEKLNIQQIEEVTGLKPTTTQKIGEKRGNDSYFETSMWGFGVTINNELKEFGSLEDAINELLDVLTPQKKQFLTFLLNNDNILWCGHFHNTFGSGPTLSYELMKKIISFQARIIISTYYSDE